jgi:hypothetical protein
MGFNPQRSELSIRAYHGAKLMLSYDLPLFNQVLWCYHDRAGRFNLVSSPLTDVSVYCRWLGIVRFEIAGVS